MSLCTLKLFLKKKKTNSGRLMLWVWTILKHFLELYFILMDGILLFEGVKNIKTLNCHR